MAKQDDYIKMQVRLPQDLHAKIKAASDMSGRSMNSEIVERLSGGLLLPDEIFPMLRRISNKYPGLSFEHFASAMRRAIEDIHKSLDDHEPDIDELVERHKEQLNQHQEEIDAIYNK